MEIRGGLRLYGEALLVASWPPMRDEKTYELDLEEAKEAMRKGGQGQCKMVNGVSPFKLSQVDSWNEACLALFP